MTRPSSHTPAVSLVLLGLIAAGPSGCGERSRTPLARSATPAMVMGSIPGIAGPTFNLSAKSGYISTPDGASIYTWGYANGSGQMQYPGPTLIVTQGEEVTVNLTNSLPLPVSILFPGHSVSASGGSDGKLAREAAASGGTVSYRFRATSPGTYVYYSGTRPELQVEMGLVGALIVRPLRGAHHAYDHASTHFHREYLFLLTEMDPSIHSAAASAATSGNFDSIDTSARWPVYWFINGRCAPDTMLGDDVGWLPSQPYGAMARMHPGEHVLMRIIGGGQDLHPFHHHGNHARVIAVDGRLLESAPGKGPDLSHEVFTVQSAPGETVDAMFQWTGKDLGWDVYGDPATYPHTCSDSSGDGFDDKTWEWCADHGKKLPVTLPLQQNLTFGGMWSGSPFLGQLGQLPPGEGGMNPNGAFPFMWHSHTEKEMVNNDIFPGGMMTMMFVEHPSVKID